MKIAIRTMLSNGQLMARQRFHSEQPNCCQVDTVETTMTSQHKQNCSHYDIAVDEEIAVDEDDGIELGNVFISTCGFFACVMLKPITLRV